MGHLPRAKLRSEAETQQALLGQQQQQQLRAREQPPPPTKLDVTKVTNVLDDEAAAATREEHGGDSGAGGGSSGGGGGADADDETPAAPPDDVEQQEQREPVDESTVPIPSELLPAATQLSSSSSLSKASSTAKKSSSKKKDAQSSSPTSSSSSSSSSSSRPARQTKKDRIKRRKEAQKRAKDATDADVGWIRALFNQIDTDDDGRITVAEMRAYANKLKLPRHFMHDFELYAVGHPGSKPGSVREDGSGETLPMVSGATQVDFDSFLMALHQKDNMLMRACTQGAANGGSSLWEEVQERGVWLVCLLVLQSVSGMVLQRYEEMLSRHVIITVFLTMLVGAGGNAGNQSAIKMIEGIAIGEISVDLVRTIFGWEGMGWGRRGVSFSRFVYTVYTVVYTVPRARFYRRGTAVTLRLTRGRGYIHTLVCFAQVHRETAHERKKATDRSPLSCFFSHSVSIHFFSAPA